MFGPSLNYFLWWHIILITKISTHQVMVLYQAMDPFDTDNRVYDGTFPYKIKQPKCLSASIA